MGILSKKCIGMLVLVQWSKTTHDVVLWCKHLIRKITIVLSLRDIFCVTQGQMQYSVQYPIIQLICCYIMSGLAHGTVNML